MALFKSYGHDSQGNMPYDMFCRRLFAGKFKMMAMDGYQKGAYSADRPKDWKFAGMIKYPFLKKSVAPPSDWDPSLAARSARPPSLAMELEHVFGYSGLSNVSPNLFYTDAGDVVYYTAAVGIVYNDDENEQMFFNHHDDDITCLGISPHDRDTVATGQVIPPIGAEGLDRRGPAGSCRLFLGPGFRLAARWNRLVETVKTRKKREKTGEKWARYGLRSVKDGS